MINFECVQFSQHKCNICLRPCPEPFDMPFTLKFIEAKVFINNQKLQCIPGTRNGYLIDVRVSVCVQCAWHTE